MLSWWHKFLWIMIAWTVRYVYRVPSILFSQGPNTLLGYYSQKTNLIAFAGVFSHTKSCIFNQGHSNHDRNEKNIIWLYRFFIWSIVILRLAESVVSKIGWLKDSITHLSIHFFISILNKSIQSVLAIFEPIDYKQMQLIFQCKS